MSLLNKIIGKIDIITAILLIIVGLSALIIGLKISNNRLEQVSVILIAAPLIYLFLRNRVTVEDISFKFRDSEQISMILASIFFILLVISILMFYLSPVYTRSLSFLVLLSIMAGVIAVQTVSTENKRNYYLILFEILILGILIRVTNFYQFTTVIGGDPWVHLSSIKSIVDLGHTSTQMKEYISFPIMHIFSASTYYLAGLNFKDSMFLIGLAEMMGLLFIFLLIREFFGEKFALMSTLFISVVSVHHIQYGFLILPQTFGIAVLGLILFLVFVKEKTDSLNYKIIYSALILVSIILSVLIHTLTSFAILIIIVSIFVINKVLNLIMVLESPQKDRSNYISLTLILFFSVFLVSYWMNEAGMLGYIGESLNWGFSVAYQSPSVSTLTESFNTTLIKILPFYLLILFSIVGFFYSFKKQYFKSISFYGWLLTFLIFSTFFLGINTLLPARWFVFIEIVLIVPFTIGIMAISNYSPKKTSVLFIIVVLLSIISLTNYEATAETVNPFTPYPTQGMKYSEEIALGTLLTKSTNQTFLYTDLGYKNNYKDQRIMDASKILAGKKNISEIIIDTNRTGIVLFRNEIIKYPYFTSALGGGHYSIATFDQSVLLKLNNNSKIYDSGSVFSFIGEVG